LSEVHHQYGRLPMSDWQLDALVRWDRNVTVRRWAEHAEMFHRSHWKSVHAEGRLNIQTVPPGWAKIQLTEYLHRPIATGSIGREFHQINYYGW
jgi:hypothetical protein